MASTDARLAYLRNKVGNANSVFINEMSVNTFCKDLTISFTGNEEYVILKLCVEGKKDCMRHPQGVDVSALLRKIYIMAVEKHI